MKNHPHTDADSTSARVVDVLFRTMQAENLEYAHERALFDEEMLASRAKAAAALKPAQDAVYSR